jgi:HEAT repeat protein
MRNLLTILGTALFVGASGLLSGCGPDAPSAPEARIDGRTRAEWVQAAKGDDPTTQADALRALARFENPPIELFESQLQAKDADLRATAILCVGTAGPDAAKWAADLAIYLEEDPEGMTEAGCKTIRNAAINTLGKIGPAAFPSMAHLLASRDVGQRRAAAFAIRQFVAEMEDGVKVFLPLAEDDDWFVRREAVRGLGEAGKGNEKAAEALLAALEDERPEVVRYAALALGGIGGRSDREGQALADLLVNHQAGIRSAAVYGLGQMGEEASPYAENVLDLLKNDSKRGVRIQAALAYYRISGDATAALAELDKSLPCSDAGLCRDALRALAEMGPAAGPTVPKLVQMLDKEQLRSLAVAALAAIGPGAKEALPALRQAAATVGEADSTFRKEVEEALAAIERAG